MPKDGYYYCQSGKHRGKTDDQHRGYDCSPEQRFHGVAHDDTQRCRNRCRRTAILIKQHRESHNRRAQDHDCKSNPIPQPVKIRLRPSSVDDIWFIIMEKLSGGIGPK